LVRKALCETGQACSTAACLCHMMKNLCPQHVQVKSCYFVVSFTLPRQVPSLLVA